MTAKETPDQPKGSDITKLPAIPKGAKVIRRPIPARPASTRSERRIYITPKTPFRSVTARVRKQLNKFLREASSSNKAFANRLAGNKHASLDDRVRAIQRHSLESQKRAAGARGTGLVDDAGEVLVCGTGRAIPKALEVAAFFQKQPDCVVQLRTGSVAAVDDVVEQGEDDEDDGLGPQGDERFRMMSCLEVSIGLR